MAKVKDLTGQRFGKLTVLKRGEDYIPPSYPKSGKQAQWQCKCECGVFCLVNVNNLRSGRQKSCGCEGSRYKTIHGMSHSLTYKSWEAYVQRCTNPRHMSYLQYKDKVYEPWVKSFETFYKDLGERPSKEFTLDRIDNEKPYSPENCRWATQSIQVHNRVLKGTSSQYKGVSFNKRAGKFEAYISNPQKGIQKQHIGFFLCEKEAAKAYNKKATEIFGSLASLNKNLTL